MTFFLAHTVLGFFFFVVTFVDPVGDPVEDDLVDAVGGDRVQLGTPHGRPGNQLRWDFFFFFKLLFQSAVARHLPEVDVVSVHEQVGVARGSPLQQLHVGLNKAQQEKKCSTTLRFPNFTQIAIPDFASHL